MKHRPERLRRPVEQGRPAALHAMNRPLNIKTPESDQGPTGICALSERYMVTIAVSSATPLATTADRRDVPGGKSAEDLPPRCPPGWLSLPTAPQTPHHTIPPSPSPSSFKPRAMLSLLANPNSAAQPSRSLPRKDHNGSAKTSHTLPSRKYVQCSASLSVNCSPRIPLPSRICDLDHSLRLR
jgi:hypothetical protein